MNSIENCPRCGGFPTVGSHSGFIACCGIKADGLCLHESTKLWNEYVAAMKHVHLVKHATEEIQALKDASVHIYNSGYQAGHHYTVEGGYVDIHSSDMDTYHAEEAAEILSYLLREKRTKQEKDSGGAERSATWQKYFNLLMLVKQLRIHEEAGPTEGETFSSWAIKRKELQRLVDAQVFGKSGGNCEKEIP